MHISNMIPITNNSIEKSNTKIIANNKNFIKNITNNNLKKNKNDDVKILIFGVWFIKIIYISFKLK